MKYGLIFITLVFCQTLICQEKNKHSLLFNSCAAIGRGDMISSIYYIESIGYGIDINKGFTIGTQLDFMFGQKRNYNTIRMKNFYNSFFVEFRPFKEKVLSPKIKTEFGYQLHSNAKDFMFNRSLGLLLEVPSPNFPPIGYFQSSGSFNNTSLSLSVKSKHFEFSFGLGYRVCRINSKTFYSMNKNIIIMHGISASLGCSYRF